MLFRSIRPCGGRARNLACGMWQAFLREHAFPVRCYLIRRTRFDPMSPLRVMLSADTYSLELWIRYSTTIQHHIDPVIQHHGEWRNKPFLFPWFSLRAAISVESRLWYQPFHRSKLHLGVEYCKRRYQKRDAYSYACLLKLPVSSFPSRNNLIVTCSLSLKPHSRTKTPST